MADHTRRRHRRILASAALALAATSPACSKDDAPGRRGPSEPEIHLKRLQRHLKAAWADYAGFVPGTAPPTPATSCCQGGRGGRPCAPDPALWSTPPWSEIGFAIENPHAFQYSYEGTWEAFTARAIGDTDCDGVTVTYELRGRIVDGEPVFELVTPANAD